MYLSVLKEHAPLKTKWFRNEQVPYMNSELRKTMYQRNMWRNKHFRNKSDKYARQNYVKLRNNKVVKLKKKSVQTYFNRKCNTQSGSKDFYKTVRPFLSDKAHSSSSSNVILREEDVLVTNPVHVAEVFNTYYASVAEYESTPDGLGNLTFDSAVNKHRNHESVFLIRDQASVTNEFFFKAITPAVLSRYAHKLQNSKAVGHDGLKSIYFKLCNSLCDIFNMCVTASFFPSEMKLAEINPIFKRKDNVCKKNYRSINLLTTASKLFENIMSDQMTEYFSDLLSSTLSAYRKGYSCQHVIQRLTEYWCQALDNGSAVGTVAMDLLRAFDKMPHALLIAKLNAYGLSEHACNMIISWILSDPSIKVLGVTLDDKLKFDEHVSEMCRKASMQIYALKRFSKYLDESCRILVYKSFISVKF